MPGALIKSADDNTINNDIATALTQSLATTGVSTMTGPILGAAGLVGAPGYTFASATKTGFYLAGTNQIGWAANGVQGATFNADTSVTFAGTIAANKGTIPIGAIMNFAGTSAPSGWLLCVGQQASTTAFAALFAVIGTTFGSGSGTFGIPDLQGRVVAGVDTGAGRLTTNTISPNANTVGAVSSGSNQGEMITLTSAQIASHTHGVTDGGHTHGVNFSAGSNGNPLSVFTGGGTAGFTGTGANASGSLFGSGGITLTAANATTGISIQAAGGGGSHGNVQPTMILNKIIYAGV